MNFLRTIFALSMFCLMSCQTVKTVESPTISLVRKKCSEEASQYVLSVSKSMAERLLIELKLNPSSAIRVDVLKCWEENDNGRAEVNFVRYDDSAPTRDTVLGISFEKTNANWNVKTIDVISHKEFPKKQYSL